MISNILHQVVWTLIAFGNFSFIFYILILKYVYRKENETLQRIAFLETNINELMQKTKSLNKQSDYIVTEEIPNNTKFYIEKKLEPLLHSLTLEKLHEMEMMKKKIHEQDNLSCISCDLTKEIADLNKKLEKFGENAS